jgi:hypothetical protein
MILVSTELFYSLTQGKDTIRESIGNELEELVWKGKKLCISMHSIFHQTENQNPSMEWIDEISIAFHQIFPLEMNGFRNAVKLSNQKKIAIDLALDISQATLYNCNSILVMKKYPKDISDLSLIPIFGKSN